MIIIFGSKQLTTTISVSKSRYTHICDRVYSLNYQVFTTIITTVTINKAKTP